MKKKTIKKHINSTDFKSIADIIQNNINEDEPIVENVKELHCRVCGYLYDDEDVPWQKLDGEWFANYEICVCCNVQFGYEDTTFKSVKKFRDDWLKKGAKFHYKNLLPKNWSFHEQLETVPKKWKDNNCKDELMT